MGASSANKGPTLPAVFSNYGKDTVDIFAPGVKIESCVPGDKYAVCGPLGQNLFLELSITGKIADAFESFKQLTRL